MVVNLGKEQTGQSISWSRRQTDERSQLISLKLDSDNPPAGEPHWARPGQPRGERQVTRRCHQRPAPYAVPLRPCGPCHTDTRTPAPAEEKEARRRRSSSHVARARAASRREGEGGPPASLRVVETAPGRARHQPPRARKPPFNDFTRLGTSDARAFASCGCRTGRSHPSPLC